MRTERVATWRSTVISTPSLEVRVIVGVEEADDDIVIRAMRKVAAVFG
jgi:hypothetical protein